MADRERFAQRESHRRERSRLLRVLLLASLVFAVIVGGITVTAMVSGDRPSLEFDYEGFD